MDFSEHLWTHPDGRLGVTAERIATQAPGIIQQFIVIFDIFRPVFEML
jgi:hypothetical protein